MSEIVAGSEGADQVMARAGKTFHRAARLLPRAVRTPVVELYAFCRRVDDLADEPGLALAGRSEALQQLADALERGDTEVLNRAGWPFAARGRMAAAARLLVLAARGDLQQRQPADEEQLLFYAFGVAGTVGIMMSEVLEAKEEGRAAAVALGMAMQLSNIARDVAEDFELGRVYFPASWVGVDEVATALQAGPASAPAMRKTREATLRTLHLADQLYAEAIAGMWTLPWRTRWSILAAALCYREIGVQVGRDVQASWRRRTVVSSGRKLWLIVRAGLRLLTPALWRASAATGVPLAAFGLETLQQCGCSMVVS